jgi:hypothetical protein
MPRQLTVVVLLMLVFAGVGSSTVVARALAQPRPLTAMQHMKRLGPKPTPHWYWRWLRWRLAGHHAAASRQTLQHRSRPQRAPRRIPHWAWKRLHFLVLARNQRAQAGGHHRPHAPPPPPPPTTSTATAPPPPPPGGLSYEEAIAYTQSRPAFAPVRTVEVGSASELRSAIAHLQPGDLVEAVAPFTVEGETIVDSRLASPAVLDLSGVSFVYSGGQNVPALYLGNPENVRIYGGDFTTSSTGGYCINMHGGQHVLFWGFYAHDCGASGVLITPVGAPVSNDDFQGQIARAGQNLAWDPCAEKGACFHGANLWDSGSAYAFTDNRFAFYIHDQASGAGVEVGNSVSALAGGNVLYEKAVNLTFVSTRQTGGNGLQLHGVSGLGLDVKYLEVDNAEGRALDSNGIYDKVLGLLGVTTEYGRSSNTNENAALNEPSNTLPWDWRGGVLYQDVLPTP